MMTSWRLWSPTAVGTAVLVAFLLFLSLFALTAPVAAASGYGAPLSSNVDVPWVYVKGGRDLGLAIILCVLLLTRQRRAVGLFVLTSAVIPLTDALIVGGRGGRVAYALAVHGSAVIYCAVLGIAILVGARSMPKLSGPPLTANDLAALEPR